MKATEVAAAAVIAVLVAGGGGYLVADAMDAVPGVLTNERPYPTPSPLPTITAGTPSPAPTLGQVPDDAAPVPDPTALTALVRQVFSTKGGPGLGAASVAVTDVATGKQLAAHRADAAATPASTTKLFTATAALAELGPGTRLKTAVVAGERSDQIVLVAGGDVLLADGAGKPAEVNGRAGLGDLARSTASALKKSGTTEVALLLDDTLFTGPRTAPTWPANYVPDGVTAPIAPLEVNVGLVKKDSATPRQADPALAAAQSFANLLKRDGIAVTNPSRGAAPAGAREIASVNSAPISEVVGYMLQFSENTVAEALGKLVAAGRGEPTDFASAAHAVTDTVGKLGANTTGVALLDCSGLSRGSKVTAAALASLITTTYDKPAIHGVIAGLPVGGLSGTLARRFHEDGDLAAIGTVRAKTGTLTGVHSLAGIVQDQDGRTLAFAALINEPEKAKLTVSSETLLDQFTADLAGCGCQQ